MSRGTDPTNGIFRRLTHPILDWAIRTEKPGLTERNFPLSAGPKTRLSEAIRYQRTVYPSTLRRTLRSYQIKHGSRPYLTRHRHQQQNRPGTIYQASKNRGIVGDSRALPKSAAFPHLCGVIAGSSQEGIKRIKRIKRLAVCGSEVKLANSLWVLPMGWDYARILRAPINICIKTFFPG